MHVIDGFLGTDHATALRNYLLSADCPWYYSFADLSYPDLPDNADPITEHKNKADALYASGGALAYRFRRSIGHEGQEECNCAICHLARFLRTGAVLAEMRAIIHHHDLKLHTLFASHYSPGDFLSPHTDKDRGRIAFVLILTENWLPQYGGNLHLLSPDWTQIEEVIVPKFNSLILFDVSGEGRPHFVSPVAVGVTQKRLAVSGWYL